MADERGDKRGVRISLIGMMGLTALIAVIIKCPPVVLAALPMGAYLGSKAIGNRSLIGATALAGPSLLLFLAVCVLWTRSHGRADELTGTCRGFQGLAWMSRGHCFLQLRPSYLPNGPKTLELQHRSFDLIPGDFDGPDKLDMILIPPEDGDINSYERWGSFAWYERRNPIYGDFIDRCALPFWYLAAITLASPIGWASVLCRSGGRQRGAVSRPSPTEAV